MIISADDNFINIFGSKNWAMEAYSMCESILGLCSTEDRKEPDGCLHAARRHRILQDRACVVTQRLMTRRTFSTDRKENSKSRDTPFKSAPRAMNISVVMGEMPSFIIS